jgi:hypothetical protein
MPSTQEALGRLARAYALLDDARRVEVLRVAELLAGIVP